jgi:hypothetical protein
MHVGVSDTHPHRATSNEDQVAGRENGAEFGLSKTGLMMMALG